jgi:hypothetical protein
MKFTHSLVIVLALAATGCATPLNLIGGSGRPHGGGADVPVWVDGGFLSVGEEPIRRKANDNAPVIFKLDNDAETDLYKFPADAMEFIQPTSEFTCSTQPNETMVKCSRTGNLSGSFKYKISVVLRSDPTQRTTLDPFIITR